MTRLKLRLACFLVFSSTLALLLPASAQPLAGDPAEGLGPYGIGGHGTLVPFGGEPYQPTALSCSIHTACPAGDGWENEISATVRVVIDGGACSGVLVNNVRQDRRPYVLTAHHCGPAAVGQKVDWRFEFGYRSPSCAHPAETPTPLTLRGGVVRAAAGYPQDFTLVELTDALPVDAEVAFAGWSLAADPPPRGAVISHPRGDLARIAFDDDPLVGFGEYWYAAFDRGTIEVGSSGAPLFDDQHRLIGLVRSALAIDHHACSGPGGDDNRARILFPRLSSLWPLGLGAVLDPDGTGTATLPALEPPPPVWIHEVNADDRHAGKDKGEFVELAGTPGLDLDGYTLAVYACAGAEASLLAEHRLSRFVFRREQRLGGRSFGFFVLGGPALPAPHRDQLFDSDLGSAINALPDGSGRLVLRAPDGTPVFDYQYDDGREGVCPTDRPTRSAGDVPGSSMGFLSSAAPDAGTPGEIPLALTPGRPNAGAASGPGTPAGRVAPDAVTLSAYPNPFNPETHLTVRVDRRQQVRVEVFEVTGRRMALLYDGPMEPGEAYTLSFEALRLPSGVYLARAAGETFVASRPLTLLK